MRQWDTKENLRIWRGLSLIAALRNITRRNLTVKTGACPKETLLKILKCSMNTLELTTTFVESGSLGSLLDVIANAP